MRAAELIATLVRESRWSGRSQGAEIRRIQTGHVRVVAILSIVGPRARGCNGSICGSGEETKAVRIISEQAVGGGVNNRERICAVRKHCSGEHPSAQRFVQEPVIEVE